MALWIHNITRGKVPDSDLHLYAVKVNQDELVRFQHVRNMGAAECFRAAADALDVAGVRMPHDLNTEEGQDG